MAEYVPDVPYLPGHHFNASDVRLDLYRLLAMVLADRQISRLKTVSTVFEELQGEHLEYEITRIMLASAIALRVEFDRHANDVWKNWKTDCGLLFDPYKKKGKPTAGIPLLLREACNKIIHATEVHWDVVGINTDSSYIRPILYLYGKKNGRHWRAKLSIVQYVRRSVAVLGGFGYQEA